MERLISYLYLFLVVNLISAFAFGQWGLDIKNPLFPERHAVEIIALSCGPAVQVGILVLVLHFIQRTDAKKRMFPRLIVRAAGAENFGYHWERFSAWAIVGFPIVLLGWFWVEFFRSRGDVWITADHQLLDAFTRVPFLTLLNDWDMYRFGDVGSFSGVSFVPYWQPILIMGGSSLLCLGVSLFVLLRVRGRGSIRSRVYSRDKRELF